jgi:hypothetical protein
MIASSCLGQQDGDSLPIGGARPRPGAKGVRSIEVRKGDKVALLSGGNPQVRRADGHAPARVCAAMTDWKSRAFVEPDCRFPDSGRLGELANGHFLSHARTLPKPST